MMTKTKNASLLLVFVLCGIAASHVAEAVFTAPLASPSRDEGEGWYFREFAVKVGSNPGPGMYLCECVCVYASVI